MASNKRIMKELSEIQTNPPTGCTVTLAKDNDMNLWDVHMDGPSDSVYAGGKFHIQITLPKEYPFKPPVLSFRTKIYHPNVSNDERGAMCLGMLKAEEWKPPNKIADVLKLVRAVLAAPQPDDAVGDLPLAQEDGCLVTATDRHQVEAGIADQFKNNRAGFNNVALEWTSKYAK